MSRFKRFAVRATLVATMVSLPAVSLLAAQATAATAPGAATSGAPECSICWG